MEQMRAAVVTVSDTRKPDDDTSGDFLIELLTSIGASIAERVIVTDDIQGLRQTLFALTERADINLIITTGGTGLSPRDNTPEATSSIIEMEVPGIAEAIRAETLKFTPMAMLSRGVCGVRNGTLLINLPGSPKGVEQCFKVVQPVLQHAVDLLEGNSRH
ncbi:MAG: MogA/MoaB family molybdenum cofactor biosynthesis protein [Pyrinomonadaceae bacterium]